MNRQNDPRLQGRGPPLVGRGHPIPLRGRAINNGRGGQPLRAPPPLGTGRGGPGRPPMMGGRGPFPGRPGRGPPIMGRGRGLPPPPPPPPPPQMMGRGPPPQMRRHSGPTPPPPMVGRPPLPGRGPMMGRGPPLNRLPPQRPPAPPSMQHQQFRAPQLNGRIPPPPRPNNHFSSGPMSTKVGPNAHPGAPVHVTRPPSNYANAQSQTNVPFSTTPPPATPSTAPATTTTTTATAPAAPVSVDEAWSEHIAPNGMKYYHNSILKESTYVKPDVLKQKEAATAKAEQPWAEYTDPNTGKKYYSNGVTTTWEKPEGFQSSTDQKEEETSEPPRKKKRPAKKETEFGSKEEAIAAFKGLLLAKDVSPTQKWNDVVKMCSSDSRWEDCENVLTIGERKQALAEYQTKRANELKTLERQERQRTREAFMQLLSDKLPAVESFSASNSRFREIRDSLSRDDRFHAVADEATRESLFLDFCEEFRKRDERKKRSKKREVQDAFLSFLKEKEEQGILTYASTWNSFISSLNESEKADARLEISPGMSDADQQLYFADFVIELQAAEDDKRRRIRDARRRAEKAQREAFREALQRLATDGKILPSSRWRAVEELIAADASFGPIREQDREAPRELFEEFLDEWNEIYRRDKTLLKQLVHPNSGKQIAVGPKSTYEGFTKALLDEAVDSPELYNEARRIISRDTPVSSSRLYFDEMLLQARDVPITTRRGSMRRKDYESSEDEGEIVEEGEVKDGVDAVKEKTTNGDSHTAVAESQLKSDDVRDGKTAENSDAVKQPVVNEESERTETLGSSENDGVHSFIV